MLRVFENKVLTKIFGAKRDDITGEWRKLHNAELHAMFSSPNIIRNLKSRRLKWARHITRMAESNVFILQLLFLFVTKIRHYFSTPVWVTHR